MQKDITVSISGSGNGAKITPGAFIILLAVLSLLSLHPLYGSSLKQYKIENIYFYSPTGEVIKDSHKFKRLLDFKEGDFFSYKNNRKSMVNLYKTGLFSDIQTRIEKLEEERLKLIFVMSPKYTIHTIKIKKTGDVKRKHVRRSILSLRKGAWFEKGLLETAADEIRYFLSARGYFNPEITYKTRRDDAHRHVNIIFTVNTGEISKVNKITFTIPNKKIFEKVKRYFLHNVQYIPIQFQKVIERVKNELKKDKYYFPVMEVEENFQDESKSIVNLHVIVKPGYQYEFKFIGIRDKIDLIASTWEKKVFEKWAEQESKARILSYLQNKGFLNAEVDSVIEVKSFIKHITFDARKNKKYRLGKIRFRGNKSFPEEELKKIVKTDDLFFDKYIWLRAKSLRVDQEVLRLFYYFNGYPSAKVSMNLVFRKKKADIDFVIDEGRKYTVDSILFNGNREVPSKTLSALLRTRNNGPFVQQLLNEDIEQLRNFYLTRGFNDVALTPEISAGTEKSIMINIAEGPAFKMGRLVIIGATKAQENLLQSLFPLSSNGHFNQLKIEEFRSNIESSSIFKEFTIVNMEKAGNVIDLLIKVKPDKTKYYGLGTGWEQNKGARVSLEYQERNIFRRYSSLSAILQLSILQLDKKEYRAILSYDTPYVFSQKINSEFKLWADNETYPSYEFFRYGVGESLIKKITGNSYVMASLSWYRTELTELDINPHGIDQLNTPFDTTAFHLSYEKEKRDDPFNPTRGYFFSSDLKIGLPIFEKNYSFVKFRWRFQKHFKFLRRGIFSFSVRNGLASGDMSITERFFAGGPNSFRGTRIDRLGPMEQLAVNVETGEPTEKPKGGNALLLLNLEATFPFPLPVVPGYDLYYSFFADIGNVYEKVPDFDLSQLRKAIGFSLKLKTPLGPIWGSVAWNMDRKEFVWSGGIGNVF
jgi:outer membrane protein assembly complex protein YaeT